MNIATLRAEGTDATLKNVSNSLSLSIDASWKQGETKKNGSKHNKSGFNACIADTETPRQLLNHIQEFLVKCKTNNITFIASDISAQMDIGIGIGSSEQFSASVTFSPSDLQYFTDLGLELCVSAYPASDDEE